MAVVAACGSGGCLWWWWLQFCMVVLSDCDVRRCWVVEVLEESM